MKTTFWDTSPQAKYGIFILILFFLISCKEHKAPDNKAIAKEENEIKFDNSNKGKDSKMLVDLADFFLKEIYLGQLAQHKSDLTDVKALGKMISVAENKLIMELVQLTESSSISLPNKPSDEVKKIYHKLNDLSGIQFEKSYCEMMVSDHKTIISLLEKLNSESTNKDIKLWASRTAADLQVYYNYSLICQQNCYKL